MQLVATALNGFIEASPNRCAVVPVPCLTVFDHIYATVTRGKLERGLQCVDVFKVGVWLDTVLIRCHL